MHEHAVETKRPRGKDAANTARLGISGMTCGNCARHVTEAIQSVGGVHSASVNLEAHEATLRWAPGAHPDLDAVIRAIEQEGYGATRLEDGAEAHDGARKLAGWQINLWIGVLGTVPLMLGEWVFGLAMAPWFHWLSFAIASVVQVFAGAQFYRGAWNQLRKGGSNMDTLVALGSTTAFGYSAWALLSGHGGHLYFMEAAAIITLISAGHWMEARVSVRASSALRKLLNLAPLLARKREPDGTERELPVAELRPGDTVVLRPGDRVPTDGELIEGESAVDESMLTGESLPVDKVPQAQVYAGTVNLNGRLLVRVTATGEQTALAHIIASVQRAQASRAHIQRLADRVSSIFVPVVVVIAMLAGAWWWFLPDQAQSVAHALGRFLWPAHPVAGTPAAAFIIAAAVLIIACPCAMGLATPAAIMAGSNAAAERGILIRDGVALEKAGEITAVIFDKTGTLTAGNPALVAVWTPDSSMPEQAALNLAGGLARHSTHPVSRAIADRAGTPAAELSDWQEQRGSGVSARARRDGAGWTEVKLGSTTWMRQSGVDLGAATGFISEWSQQGATIVVLAVNGSAAGLFAVKDTLKPGAPNVLRRLHEQGLRTFLVTGDNSLTAASIARQAGIARENVIAEVRPEQKAEQVRKLQQGGHRVAFVGDGINDAPALEQADLGIAVSRASDIAREAADVILLNSEIEAVPESLGLARATLRTIRQNLFWAFFYNGVGVPLAALGFMSPILCAAAMGVSDLVVIGNALRLRRWRLR